MFAAGHRHCHLEIDGEHEAFYFQDRIGYMGKTVKVTKFVTMVKDSPNLGTGDITLRNDPRVLPVGKFLRKTKLNEIPQFWDVFIGTLSLVGWRPLMPRGFSDYSATVQEKIVHIKPGLTGIGSLVFRDEEGIMSRAKAEGRNPRDCYRDDIMQYKGAVESWYVDHQGLLVDLKILVATALVVLLPNWTGYLKWFHGLPTPESPMIREMLQFASKPTELPNGTPGK